MQACVRCVRAGDEGVEEPEMMLLRAVGAALRVPLPARLVDREADGVSADV